MNIPRRVIAKKNDMRDKMQFMKGDTIEITSKGDFVDYIGVNLTRPEMNNEYGSIYLYEGDYKELSKSYYDEPKKDYKTIYFLGIPLIKIK